MYKAYGGEPSVDLLQAFLNLGPAGNWLTLSNRGGFGIPKALTKPIIHIEGWKGSFFFIKNKIVPSEYPELFLENNKLDKKYFKDMIPTRRNYQEELFTLKEDIDLETAQTNTTAKLPILKQGEYEMWKLRIEQYFQVQDYALWDVIENGNSFNPVAQTTTNAEGCSTTLILGPYKDAKTLFAAIQTRFGGNKATKKTHKTLLKQMYKNFSALSTESLDSIFNRLKKINTHVVVWRNKPDLDTMSFDDLYNNFKIVEQEVKGTTSSNSSSSSQNMAFMSSPSSTNEVNTAYEVNTANTQVSPASTQVSTASTQVECFNRHKIGHFTRECKGPRNQDNRNRNQDSSRRTVNVEETSSKAMLAINGAGFDWSYMAR
ncbi:hypothetical protein Tco_0866829 [Tanacetum coccineum]